MDLKNLICENTVILVSKVQQSVNKFKVVCVWMKNTCRIIARRVIATGGL